MRRGARRTGTSAAAAEEAELLAAAQDLQARIDEFRGRQYYAPIWVHGHFVESSGTENRVTQMLNVSGWPRLLQLHCDGDVDDTAEFLATFHYIGTGNDEGFSYHHRGTLFTCTMVELRHIFGWADHDPRVSVYTPHLDDTFYQIWTAVATGEYQGGESKARAIREPALYYLHHILSKTLFAKKNTSKVGRDELAVLHMLHVGTIVHWGHYFCKHFKNLRANSPICCGGMITHILRHRHPLPVPEHHQILPGVLADTVWFLSGQNIRIVQNQIQWCYFEDPALRPAVQPPRRGRPPGRGRGRGRAAGGQYPGIHEQREEEPQQEPPPQQHQYQYPQGGGQQDYIRMMIDMFFNSTRSSLLGGQQVPFVPAPPGWRPGYTIPPEYL